MILLASDVARAGYGGIQTVNRLVMAAAVEAGIAGSVLSWRDTDCTSWQLPGLATFCAGGSRLRYLLGALVRRHSARHSVILVGHVKLAPVGRMLKALTGARQRVFIHGQEAWSRQPPAIQWGLRTTDTIVAVSEFTLARFRESNAALRGVPTQVCYLPARNLHAGLTATRGESPRSPDLPPLVLTVGRLWRRGLSKGQRELIGVWPQVLVKRPAAELWIVGDGEGRADLELLAEKLGVRSSVIFTGAVPDTELARIYASSDVYAMPSHGEGFGLVFAEAMAHGLPCVASRLDAGAEVVVHGETGLLVDPSDPANILHALEVLLSDRELRTRMGRAGRGRAAKLFSLDAFNRRIARLLTPEGHGFE